ncbi:MAG: VOC family protein [Armatimonadetes bacterium]|jgi:glyoxylase I family protein|nr:VOC family protein [Armatimonadota bacterium]
MSTNAVIEGLGFHHAALQTTDYEGTKRFYTEVLGCRLAREWGSGDRRLCLLDLGDGGCIEVIGAAEAPTEPVQQFPMIHLALRVADVDAAIARVRAAGRTVTLEPRDADLGGKSVRIAFFLGPCGELLEFFQE